MGTNEETDFTKQPSTPPEFWRGAGLGLAG
jgi:hypothetical protein